jgi:hypothetical protein
VQALLSKVQEQAKGVAIRTDRVGAYLALSYQALKKKPLQECREIGSFHD